jgi:uncharacterized surface protein with fasciclin (FAS1) repeats
MHMKRQFLKYVLAASAALTLAACGGSDDPAPTPTPAPTKNIVELAQGTPDLSILVEAVVAAGLVPNLSGAGPLTVFAPTNAAFAAALTELGLTKAELLAPANKTLLTQILTYHVVSGKFLKAQVPIGAPITTLQGESLTVAATPTLAITDQRGRKANITATDIQATNGVVHVIDKVILPTNKNVVQVAQGNPDFSVLVEAVVAAGLAPVLSGPGPFTVFAPTNAAFTAALTELGLTKAQLLDPVNKTLLTKILTYHVVSGKFLKAQVPVGTPIATLQTETITVDSTLTITDQRGRKAKITATDIAATNGVVHVIDKVILPKP